MLHEFVAQNREEIIQRCRVKVAARPVPPPTPAELTYGIPRFLDQLVEMLKDPQGSTSEMDLSAANHGRQLRLQGFTVSQVVHDYGDVCQSIADLAMEKAAPISVDDFRTLNRCLDDAMASAVTEYGRERYRALRDFAAAQEDQRFGFLAHEVRNLVHTASMAFEVLRSGNVGAGGSTGAVLKRSLSGLTDLIDRSVAEVRFRHNTQDRVDFVVADLIDELSTSAAMEATARGLQLTVTAGEAGLSMHADRQIVSAVVVNLLQNAFKFTRPHSSVALTVTASEDHVKISVADECGGLPDGNLDDLFRPFEQRSADRTGLGLGLAFCRWGAEVNDGRISTRNLPDHGCVFSIELPRMPGLHEAPIH
jgi:signal transduction histidine kinase